MRTHLQKGENKGTQCDGKSIPFNFGWSLCPKHAPWVKKALEIMVSREIAEEFPVVADFWNEDEDISYWVEEMSTYPDPGTDPDPWTEVDFQGSEIHVPCNEGYEEEDKNVWFVNGKEVTQEVAEAEALRLDGVPTPGDMGALREAAMGRVKEIRKADDARRLIEELEKKRKKALEREKVLKKVVDVIVEKYTVSEAAAWLWVRGPYRCTHTLEKGVRKGFACGDFRESMAKNNHHGWPLCRRHCRGVVPISDTDHRPKPKS